jgi:hypothetical protein
MLVLRWFVFVFGEAGFDVAHGGAALAGPKLGGHEDMELGSRSQWWVEGYHVYFLASLTDHLDLIYNEVFKHAILPECVLLGS